jgi:hypothetical protein
VDAHLIVPESNENNNVASRSISVGAPTTATRTPTPTVTRTPTPLPGSNCTAPFTALSTSPVAPGSLQVTVRSHCPGTTLRFVEFFVSPQVPNPNALIDIGAQRDLTAPQMISLPVDSTQISFVVRRASPGATTLPFRVGYRAGGRDGVEEKFVGGGPTAY